MGALDEAGEERRGFLRCAAWAGAGLVWTMVGGVPISSALAGAAPAAGGSRPFSFAQVSDSHIGFSKPFNPDARVTFQAALDKVGAARPDLILHTGDVSQLSKPDQFDDADQLLKATGLPVVLTPGEHDVLDEGGGAAFLARYGKGSAGGGWRSFDHGGVHFVGLANVLDLKPGGMGSLGPAQLAWLAQDLAPLRASTPIVVYAHMPLWSVYAPWGWGTDDAPEAMRLLARFGSVTVLNGHIHQVQQKVEGHVAFYTARSTAFPQAAPGAPGASPGPLATPADQLRQVLGVREISFVSHDRPLPVVDQTLA